MTNDKQKYPDKKKWTVSQVQVKMSLIYENYKVMRFSMTESV